MLPLDHVIVPTVDSVPAPAMAPPFRVRLTTDDTIDGSVMEKFPLLMERLPAVWVSVRIVTSAVDTMDAVVPRHALSEVPGRTLVLQLAASCQEFVPAPPSQLIVQVGAAIELLPPSTRPTAAMANARLNMRSRSRRTRVERSLRLVPNGRIANLPPPASIGLGQSGRHE